MRNATPHSPGRPLSDRAAFLISQLGYHSAARFVERLAPLGLRPRHFGLLSHLDAADGQTQQQLADALAIHRNAMVGLVDDLEQLGLVARHRHPEDRRAHAVHLTTAARDLLARAQLVADEHDAELLAGLDWPDQRQLVSLLQRLAHHAGLAPGVHPGLRSPANALSCPSDAGPHSSWAETTMDEEHVSP